MAKIYINRDPVQPPLITTSPTKQEGVTDNVKSNFVTYPSDTGAVKLNTGSLSLADRAKLRQQKFGSPSDPPTKLKQRAERFGVGSTDTNATGKVTLTTDETARLAKRRDRFAAELKDAEPTVVRKVKRAERFGISDGATVSKETEDKKGSRAARFGLNT